MSEMQVSAPRSSLSERLYSTSPWTLAVIALCCLYVIVTSRLQFDIHRGLGTSSFDVGLYDQGMWLLSRFEAPFVTLMGRNMFGDHASLILFLLTPLYWIAPGTESLLAVQSAVVAAGALPIYFFARRHLESSFLGLLMAVVWLVNPAVNGTVFENFHPDSFLGLFVPLAIVSALDRRWGIYWVAVVLSLLVKEDVLLVVIPLGVLVALRGDKRRGAATIVLALGSALAGMYLLMKSLIGVPTRNGWRIPFGGVRGFITEAFTNPTNVAGYLSSEGRLMYWWKMFAPFSLLSLAAPEVAMVSALVLISNTVSNFWYQFHIEYHYSLVAVPALLVASVVAVARLSQSWRRILTVGITITSLFCASAWSYVPFRLDEYPHWSASNPIAVAARDLAADIPTDARISVYHSLAPHLAHRKQIFQFPNPFYIVLYGTDVSIEGQRNPLADGIEYIMLPRQLDGDQSRIWATIEPDFIEFKSNEHWQIFRSRSL